MAHGDPLFASRQLLALLVLQQKMDRLPIQFVLLDQHR
jgi:hypothetical protein